MPGIGVRTCARILTEVTSKLFASAAHLASSAGIAPVTRRSGTRSGDSTRAGAATRNPNGSCSFRPFGALHRRASRAYYPRKRAESKRHNQALIALAHCGPDVLFAMLRDGTLYEDPVPKNLPSAAGPRPYRGTPAREPISATPGTTQALNAGTTSWLSGKGREPSRCTDTDLLWRGYPPSEGLVGNRSGAHARLCGPRL